MSSSAQKAVNRGVARAIPVLLLAIIGHAIFTFVDQLCVKYLIRPPITSPHGPRSGTAAGLIVGFFILLIPVLVTFGRLLHLIATNPGVLPRGALWHERRRRRRSLPRESEKPTPVNPGNMRCTAQPRNPTPESVPLDDQRNIQNPPPGLEKYYNRPLFACEDDGYPRWCAKCLDWKPERAHHCSEVDRCVQKLDHFCPWVGGVVSITSFKFFIQFVSYSAALCIYVMVTLAIFTAEQDADSHTFNVHWIVAVAISGLLGLFTLGMSGTSLHLALVNSSTIENFDRKTKVWQLAVYLPDPTVDVQTYATTAGDMCPATKVTFPPLSYLERLPADAPLPPSRTFCVLRTLPGQNPWNCGPARNFRDVMGEHWYQWVLPVKLSPLLNRGPDESLYLTGRVVRKMMRKSGISAADRQSSRSNTDTLSRGVGEGSEPRTEQRKRRRRGRTTSTARDQEEQAGSQKGKKAGHTKREGSLQSRPEDSAVSGMS